MRAQRVRLLAVGATAGSAILYYLIGFGVLDIGEATSGGETDLLGFGLVAGTTFMGAAVITLVVKSRWLLGAIGLLDAAVIAGYFAMASLREPPYEVWGLTIKVLQVVSFIAITILIFAGRGAPTPSQAVQPDLAPKAGAS